MRRYEWPVCFICTTSWFAAALEESKHISWWHCSNGRRPWQGCVDVCPGPRANIGKNTWIESFCEELQEGGPGRKRAKHMKLIFVHIIYVWGHVRSGFRHFSQLLTYEASRCVSEKRFLLRHVKKHVAQYWVSVPPKCGLSSGCGTFMHWSGLWKINNLYKWYVYFIFICYK